ncbi:hypothetical protein [Spirosoma sp. KUDC1026]|uniref:hypothetical protein n=1 Tax=Spirosoma sp. KUDC1026 TaxID=2745947 RepID=UPI00159BA4C1|nr:hypothetical protein [Spirosoma sp. KUDC1026]QKZ15259.1 hypothetical protein HU175_22580 [Spirosoma sp. KUDC1026]
MNRMVIWRIAGIALVAGLALFLVSLLIKLVLVVLAVGLTLRIVGGYIASRFFGAQLGRGRWQQPQIISIDNPTPAYQAIPVTASYDRIIPIG